MEKGIITLNNHMEQKISFTDLGKSINYYPCYFYDDLNDRNFSGYYLPVVNGKKLSPVSSGYTIIKSEYMFDIIKNVLGEIGIDCNIMKEIDRNIYHKLIIKTNIIDEYSDEIFENKLQNYFGIDIDDLFDYNYKNFNKDILTTCIELYNSYCGYSQVFITIKLVRMICENGLVVGDEVFRMNIKHNLREENVEKEVRKRIPILINNFLEIKRNYFLKMNKQIPLKEAIKILDIAHKYGISTRYIKKLKEKVIPKIEQLTKFIKLYWLWNLLTYNIERNSSILNSPLRQYTIYKKFFSNIISKI